MDFTKGVTTPIPKFKGLRLKTSIEDYRGITVNPIISKIFEHCLAKFLTRLTTSNRQFGFKKGVGCLNAIHTLRKSIKYFNSYGNTVNLAFIDIAKAFDKTDIFGILVMLKEKGINHYIIKVLESWFSCSIIQVNWNGVLSQTVSMPVS